MGLNDLYISKCLIGWRVWCGRPGGWFSIVIGHRLTHRGAERLAARARTVMDTPPELYR